MKHRASPKFWQFLNTLPEEVQAVARANFELLKSDSKHPSLHLKKAGRYWSVRVGIGHRALAIEAGADLLWIWIGTHADYDKLLNR